MTSKIERVFLGQGIHDGVAMDDYIGDPCEEPALSTGVANALLNQTPAHAHLEHPRLGGKDDKGSTRSDLGSAAHSALLGGSKIVYVDAKDFKTKAAKSERDEAREAGDIPLLEKQRSQIAAMVSIARETLRKAGLDGPTEQTLIAKIGGVWARGRSDMLPDVELDLDYKTTTSADPATWIRTTLIRGGYDVQAGLRLKILEEIEGRSRDFLWLLQEIDPPYLCSLVGMGPDLKELALRKVDRAIGMWGRCLTAKKWPGYTGAIHWAEAPSWALYDFEDRETMAGGVS